LAFYLKSQEYIQFWITLLDFDMSSNLMAIAD